MGTGQTILTIGAMLLLSVLVLRINSTLLFSGGVVSTSKLGMTAVSLAQSHLEEIKSKAYDEKTVTSSISTLSKLTAVASLGPDGSEVYPNFDDIDDYNNVLVGGKWVVDTVQIDPNLPKTKSNIELYTWTCTVTYVTNTSPFATASTPTWNKMITIYVTNNTLKDTIKLSTIYSYWVFR